jgi:hypothetical protein
MIETKDGQEMPEDLKNFIKNSEWIFAKTYAHFAPHNYIVKNYKNKEMFERLVIYIREHGVVRKWGSRIGLYLDYNGHSYWTMGNPIPETTIINRKDMVEEDKLNELPRSILDESKLPYVEERKIPQKKLFDFESNPFKRE